MHETKHDILRTRSHETRMLLLDTAAARGLTVDELVCAGLGRPASPAAVEAAAALKEADPRAFVGLHHWPYECAFCGGLSTGVTRCLFCDARGCAACVIGTGCPPCTVSRRKRNDENRAAAVSS